MKQIMMVLGLAIFILTTGCLGSDEPLTTEACSNSRYSTINLSGQVDYPYVTLTWTSRRRLEQAILANGSAALTGITDLQCLTWLDLAGSEIKDIAPLTQLINLRYLDVSYTDLSHTPSQALFDSLELLNLAGTNVSQIECGKLNNEIARTKVICPD